MRKIKSKNFYKKCDTLAEILCKRVKLQAHLVKLEEAKEDLHLSICDVGGKLLADIRQYDAGVIEAETKHEERLAMLETELEELKEFWPWI